MVLCKDCRWWGDKTRDYLAHNGMRMCRAIGHEDAPDAHDMVARVEWMNCDEVDFTTGPSFGCVLGKEREG